MDYKTLYSKSIEEPELFWKEEAQKLAWSTYPEQILKQNENGYYSWFVDGKINMSRLALEENIKAGRGEQFALIYDSPVTEVVQKITYNQLLEKVSRFAGGLTSLGLSKGDTAIIYMPMIPEAIVAMLACARIGVIHSVVFGGFAAPELAIRIDDAQPDVIISASYGVEINRQINYKPLIDEAIELTLYKPKNIVIFERPNHTDDLSAENVHTYDEMYQHQPIEPIEVPSTHPLYILYTSGTTSTPKGVVRDTGGYATALNSTMNYFYDLEPGDTILTASDIGWVVGHSYIVYAPLIYGVTTVIYEGKPIKTPDAGAFWRMVEEHKIKNVFTAPTAIRAIRKEDPEGKLFQKYDTSSLKRLFLAGERCDTSTYYWLKEISKLPVIDHWWQTESGWPMLGICVGIENIMPEPGAAGLPVFGYNIKIVNEEGQENDIREEGSIVIQLPLPPGCMTSLWRNEHRFIKGYFQQFPNHYLTGDGGFRDENGFVFITGRTDDIINVAGHRLSTATMEELVSSHPDITECAVVGIKDELKGQIPIGLIVTKENASKSEEEIEKDLIALLRKEIGGIACFKTSIIVNRLPKTRSGKILRKTLSQIADGTPFTIPSTIDDATVLDELIHEFSRRNVGLAFAISSI
ncbi:MULTISPECIES: AMP-binding protein [Empedobacter]|uniref:Acetyl-coenzyme A synthetase n=4 Tax=Weeksellaceae TaxID=2762318 RepID=A0A376G929_9FLAO|nr:MULTISPECIES: AMP-binding protein [Empedobacter]MBY0066177.1 AMP-binding protein [Empedobacter falsenii]MDH0659143.1 AMP-binding protein [Empedobacter sp. GD03865]MDH0674758.1 AMP-binding protein [Empedobacter sp. GD03861]MDM1137489.1 AMP-binding protein [Empedobacter sp. R132-2]RRT92898.1 propionyl-CoA synthetase [Empedobacter falsenii]